MREIKFRAWLNEHKFMLNDENHGTEYAWSIGENGTPEVYWLGEQTRMQEPEDAEVMQYTGLKDKNGVEIYEGDIFAYHVAKYQVVWQDDEARFFAKTNRPDRFHDGYTMTLSLTDACEVIGNIYENGDLLR